MISNFLNNPLLQQYLNRNFAQPVDTGMPVQNKLYQQPYNMFDVAGGITSIPTNINQQPFNDYYGPNNIDTSFGVANEEDVEEDVEGARRTGGLADLLRTAINFAIPGAGLFMGAGRGALEGIQSLNQRFRNTMFGQSATGAEFFQKLRDKRAREEAARRGALKQKQIIASQQVDTGDIGGGGAGSSFDAPSGGTFGSSVNDAGSFSDYS
jgi:hypothetical protein